MEASEVKLSCFDQLPASAPRILTTKCMLWKCVEISAFAYYYFKCKVSLPKAVIRNIKLRQGELRNVTCKTIPA